jgi:hypothetical protein
MSDRGALITTETAHLAVGKPPAAATVHHLCRRPARLQHAHPPRDELAARAIITRCSMWGGAEVEPRRAWGKAEESLCY